MRSFISTTLLLVALLSTGIVKAEQLNPRNVTGFYTQYKHLTVLICSDEDAIQDIIATHRDSVYKRYELAGVCSLSKADPKLRFVVYGSTDKYSLIYFYNTATGKFNYQSFYTMNRMIKFVKVAGPVNNLLGDTGSGDTDADGWSEDEGDYECDEGIC